MIYIYFKLLFFSKTIAFKIYYSVIAQNFECSCFWIFSDLIVLIIIQLSQKKEEKEEKRNNNENYKQGNNNDDDEYGQIDKIECRKAQLNKRKKKL